jgi:hypothetical protein
MCSALSDSEAWQTSATGLGGDPQSSVQLLMNAITLVLCAFLPHDRDMVLYAFSEIMMVHGPTARACHPDHSN